VVQKSRKIDPAEAEELKVFISHSRDDLDFVKNLAAALQDGGITVLIDSEDIEKGEKVWSRIEQLIAESHAVVFVLSPDSVRSAPCQQEVKFASSLNKRFLPVVAREIEDHAAPGKLAVLDYIYFIRKWRAGASGNFDEAFDDLVRALHTDIGWIREHTRLGDAALRWSRNGKPKHMLLRGAGITSANEWLSAQPATAPEPSGLHRQFIDASRKAAKTRRLVLIGVTAIVATVIVAGAIAVVILRHIASLQAEATAIQESYRLAKLADERILKGDAVSGMLIALEALPDKLRDNHRPFVAAAESSLIQGWQIKRESAVLDGHSDVVSLARFSPGGQHIVTGSWDDTARLWDVKTGMLLHTLGGHVDAVTAAAFAPDGHSVVTADHKGIIRLWETATGRLTHKLPGHVARVRLLDFSKDGRKLISGSYDRSIRIWNVENGESIAVLRNLGEKVLHVQFASGMAIAVTASKDGILRVRDVLDNQVLNEVPTHLPDGISKALVSPAIDRIAVITSDRRLQLWDANSRELLFEDSEMWTATPFGAFSLDGKWLLVAKPRKTHVWDAISGKKVTTLQGPKNQIMATVAISPNGNLVATAFVGGTIFIWDRKTGHAISVVSGIGRVAPLRGHQSHVRRIEFSPDGQRIVSASFDKTARVWDVARAVNVKSFVTSQSNTTVAFDVTIRGSERLRQHIEGKDRFFDYARRSVPRCLTIDQRAELLIEREPPGWCIELAKWPYGSRVWRGWLKAKEDGENPPLP